MMTEGRPNTVSMSGGFQGDTSESRRFEPWVGHSVHLCRGDLAFRVALDHRCKLRDSEIALGPLN
jgi:hypothetical protein